MAVEAVGFSGIEVAHSSSLPLGRLGVDISADGVNTAILTEGVADWARTLLVESDGFLRYVLIFLLAATPLLEILVVIPIGIGIGLQPVLVAVAAFLGNVLPIYGIIVGHERLAAYLDGRRSDDNSDEPSSRRKRAKRIWDRYGLPGLAIASPLITGVHLAALLALGLGSKQRSTAVWMTASIAVWTVIITAVSVGAMSAITSFL